MKTKTRPLYERPDNTLAICDICGKGRSNRRHQRCSKIRQARFAKS